MQQPEISIHPLIGRLQYMLCEYSIVMNKDDKKALSHEFYTHS